MSKDSQQTAKAPKQFKLGHLGTLNQVIVALGKTIRAMADGTLDSQVGSRICNGLGIMRQCLETQSKDPPGTPRIFGSHLGRSRPSLRMRNGSHSLPPAPVTDELWPAALPPLQNDSGLPKGPAGRSVLG